MNELHLFAGAGGGILGGILLGHTCVCAVEIEPYRQQVLLQRQRDGILPRFPIWDDIKTFDGKPWRGLVDVVCGGFPCQDISIGGNGAGIEGERSGLWKEMARVISEVRPSYILMENSPMLVSRGLGLVLTDLAQMGIDAEWGIVGANACGYPHKRLRFWGIGFNTNQGDANRVRISSGKNVHASLWSPSKAIKERERWERELVSANVAQGFDSYADALRALHGISNWMDRLESVADGQVPAVVKLAWETLTQW